MSHQLSLANGLLSTLAGTQAGATLSTLRLPEGAVLTGEAPGRYVLGQLQITRNTVYGQSGNAITFSGSNNVVDGNQAYSGLYGLNFGAATSGNIYSNNRLSGSGTGAINLNGGGSNQSAGGNCYSGVCV